MSIRHVLVPLAVAAALALVGCPKDGDGSPSDPDLPEVTADIGGADLQDPDVADVAGLDAADVPSHDVIEMDPGSVDEGPLPDTVVVDAEPDANAPLEPGQWCGQWSAAWCELLARCPTGVFGVPLGDDCVPYAEAECWHGQYLADAVAAGSVQWDGEAASGCLAELPELACESFHDAIRTGGAVPTANCADAIRGTGVPGSACSLGVECATGSRCVFGASCPGECQAFVPLDGACGPLDWCEPGQAQCVAETCVALPGLDEGCAAGLCKAPLACNPIADTCVAPSLEGGSCGADGLACFAGLVCLRANEGELGTCVAPRQAGESCFETTHCDPASPDGALVCIGGECQQAPGVGQPCYDFRCNAGWCDPAALPPTCQPLPGAGEACAQGGLCGSSLWCEAGQCATLVSDGDACTAHQQCLSERCYGGLCVASAEPPCAP